MPKGRTFMASQKTAIVLEALNEEKTIAQIAFNNGVYPNQIHKWNKLALENFQQLFENDRQGEMVLKAAHKKQLDAVVR